jgi:signal transduction histidine kinase
MPEAMPDDITLPRILQLAIERSVDQSPSLSPQEPSCGDLRILAERVAAVLEENGRDGSPSEESGVDATGHRRLRAAVLSAWKESHSSPDIAEVLRVLDALDRIPAPGRAGTDGMEGERDPLGIPTTPDLIVELAHDLRSPLTSILFLTDALRREQSGEVNPLQRQQLGIIYSAALGLVSMTGDVIEYARGGDSRPRGRPAPFSVSQLLESIHDLVQPMTEARGISLRLSCPDHDHLLGHPVPLSRVLLNLTTNAVKATEKGHVAISVRQVREETVEFSVIDTGCGLEPEAEETLFLPFRAREEGSRIGFSGTGLGLDICRRLVAAMGGDLRYETTPGEGTRFFFTLHMPPALNAS